MQGRKYRDEREKKKRRTDKRTREIGIAYRFFKSIEKNFFKWEKFKKENCKENIEYK